MTSFFTGANFTSCHRVKLSIRIFTTDRVPSMKKMHGRRLIDFHPETSTILKNIVFLLLGTLPC